MKYLTKEIDIVKKLQIAIEKSPSYRTGMIVKHTGAGVEIQINGEPIDKNEQCLVLADAHNTLTNSKD